MSAFRNTVEVEKANNLVMNTLFNSSKLEALEEVVSECNGLHNRETRVTYNKVWARKEWRGNLRVWNETEEKFEVTPVSLSIKVMRETGDVEVSLAFADWEVWSEV